MFGINKELAELIKTAKMTDSEDVWKLVREKFFDAVRENDVNVVRKLMAIGVDVNAARLDYIGNGTALMLAASNNAIDVARVLIKAGADVNARDSLGVNALMWAQGNVSMMRELIAAGADVNARTNDGETALMRAAGAVYDSTADSVRTLIKAGADVNAKDNNGNTALSRAKYNAEYVRNKEDNKEIMKLLLRAMR